MITYSPSYRLRTSPIRTLKAEFSTVVKFRQFITANFFKHFRASYQRSFLHLLWKIVLPLVPVSVYVILQELGLLHGASGMPRILYVVIGMTFWQTFASALTAVISAPDKEKTILKKLDIPFLIFYISSTGEVIFDYMVRVGLIYAVLIWVEMPFNFAWLALPVLFIPLLLLALVAGIFISFFATAFDDLKHLVQIFLRYALFASGVIFPIEGFAEAHKILNLNPVYILLDNLRNFVVYGEIPALTPVLWVVLASALFLLFTLHNLYILEPRLREML